MDTLVVQFSVFIETSDGLVIVKLWCRFSYRVFSVIQTFQNLNEKQYFLLEKESF